METPFRLDALDDALRGGAVPEILNTDQCLQFTGNAFKDAVLATEAQVLMDGVGRWTDNVFIERLWWSLKHEEVHGKDLADGFEAAGRWVPIWPATMTRGRTKR